MRHATSKRSKSCEHGCVLRGPWISLRREDIFSLGECLYGLVMLEAEIETGVCWGRVRTAEDATRRRCPRV